jgi:hypothetical protein
VFSASVVFRLSVFRVVFKSQNTLIMLLSTYCIVHE